MFWKNSWICDLNRNFPYRTLKFKVSMFSLIFAFSRIFGAKRKHNSPVSSESAKDLVRISVLAEKLDSWCKLLFAAQDAKT